MADEPNSTGTGGPAVAEPEPVSALIKRASKGDDSTLPRLRELLNDPRRAGLVAAYGSPPLWLESKLIDDAAGENLVVKEAGSRNLEKIRRDLEGPDPSPMEKLLAERAAICWWLIHRYEYIYANAEGQSLRQAEYHQRRIDKAHGRFLSALRTLATVRKLALPALQVNIGANQVNTVQADVGR